MSIIKREDIKAVRLEGKIICLNCFDGKLDDLSFNEIITEEEMERSDDIYYCDICGKAI